MAPNGLAPVIDETNRAGRRRPGARPGRRRVRAAHAPWRDHGRHRHQGCARRVTSRSARPAPPTTAATLVHRRHAAARHRGVVRQPHHQPALGRLRWRRRGARSGSASCRARSTANPNIPLPDRGSNAVCNRPGKSINQDGGHGGATSCRRPAAAAPRRSSCRNSPPSRHAPRRPHRRPPPAAPPRRLRRFRSPSP